MLNPIPELFGLKASDYRIMEFGSGLINHTWKVKLILINFLRIK